MYHFKTALFTEIAFINFVWKIVKEMMMNIPYDVFQLIYYECTIRGIYYLDIQEGHNVFT